MSDKDKVIKAVELYDQIQELFPRKSVSLTIHDLHRSDMPSDFTIKEERGLDAFNKPTKYFTAKRNNKAFDITLFGNHEDDDGQL